MKNKNIAVLLKYFKGELNPFDGAALECALSTGASVTAVSMAPRSALPALQTLTRLGVKAILISDEIYAGSDTQATSLVLAETLKKLNPDLIFCGRQSIDGDTAQVPPMLAERLGYDIKVGVIELNDGSVKQRNGNVFTLQDKTVYTFEKIRTLRFPSIFSKAGEVKVWDNAFLNLSKEKCGLEGSPTRVVRSYESSVGSRNCQFAELKELSALIEKGLKKPRVSQIKDNGEKLDEIYFVGNIKAIAENIAHKVIELTVDGKTPNQFAKELEQNKIKTVLWEDSENLKIYASKTAVLTGAGLCADCISFRVENKKLIMTRPALGGNVSADIVCQSAMSFATVRTVKNESAEVIFSIGKGATHKIDEIKEWAKKYGAEVCCSRVVADSGKMPYEKQVGLTGRTVCPKVYVAFGVSGAVQHTSAIAGAGTVIAVNKNKNERIFDYADYGIIAEV